MAPRWVIVAVAVCCLIATHTVRAARLSATPSSSSSVTSSSGSGSSGSSRSDFSSLEDENSFNFPSTKGDKEGEIDLKGANSTDGTSKYLNPSSTPVETAVETEAETGKAPDVMRGDVTFVHPERDIHKALKALKGAPGFVLFDHRGQLNKDSLRTGDFPWKLAEETNTSFAGLGSLGIAIVLKDWKDEKDVVEFSNTYPGIKVLVAFPDENGSSSSSPTLSGVEKRNAYLFSFSGAGDKVRQLYPEVGSESDSYSSGESWSSSSSKMSAVASQIIQSLKSV